MQLRLAEEHVEFHAVGAQHVLDALEHPLDADPGELRGVHRRGAGDLRGELADVVALVAALRDLLAARAGEDRSAELLDLRAGVVEVVLAADVVAAELEQPRERVAIGAVPPACSGHRPGGVRGDELDVDALGGVGAAAAEVAAGGQHVVERLHAPGIGEEEVQEAGAGDVDTVERGAETLAQLVGEARGDVARRRARDGREQHRGVRRVVAEAGLLRTLERRRGALGPVAAGDRAGGVLNDGAQLAERCVHGFSVVSSGTARPRGSCGRGRAARAARRARAGGAA